MRFKAKLAPEQLSMLYQVIIPLSRIAASGGAADGATSSVWTRNGTLFCIDNKFFRISTKGKNEADNIRCFAELTTQGGIFLEHRIESAAENNTIVMEVDLVQFRLALQSICHEQQTRDNAERLFSVLKLAKRNNIPCLCLDALTSSNLQVHHSIPVRILRASEMQHPPQPIPNIQIELNPEKPLKPIVETLKAMGSAIYLEATVAGALTVASDTDGASIRTFISNLKVATTEGQSDCTVKVDPKKLSAALQWQGSPCISSALLCLVANEMVVLHVMLHPREVGFFTYYIPVQYLPLDRTEE